MNERITTITFFKYKGFRDKWWGLGMMGKAHGFLAEMQGLHFYKLMGCGKNEGFNPYPDWSTYSLLAVWDKEADAERFLMSELMNLYHEKTIEMWTIFMKNIVAKGMWSGQNPFAPSSTLNPDIPLIAVITRARIKTKKLISFWRYVPTSHLQLRGNEGLIYSNGIGEIPVVQMATFSIWKDKTSLMDFAYKSREHHIAIQKTRQLDWYKEEMFTRFQPYKSVGTWKGMNPLVSFIG